jgi:hypothetical protein
MSSVQFDFAGVESNIREFPNGPVEAIVKSAMSDVSRKGNPLIRLELEIHDPNVGTATLRDTLPQGFPAKAKAFWIAVNDFAPEEVADLKVDIDPDTLVGAQLIIELGEKESNLDGKLYKQVSPPWYYPLSRAEELFTER